MNPQEKALQLLANLRTVLRVFEDTNWPDTEAGHAANNLHNNYQTLQKWIIEGAVNDPRKDI